MPSTEIASEMEHRRKTGKLSFGIRVPERWTRLGSFAAWSALAATMAIAVFATWRWYGQDFDAFYLAAKLVLAGQNPYDYPLAVARMNELLGHQGNSPYYYPIWWVLPFIPLAAVPFQAARFGWTIVNAVLWLAALRLMEDVLDWKLASWQRWLVWLCAFILFGWITLKTEQASIAILLDLIILLGAIKHQHTKTAAIALALLPTKPQITFLVFGGLVFALWRRQKSMLLGMVASLICLLGISVLVTPAWWEPILVGKLPQGLTQGLTGLTVEGRRLTTTSLDFLNYNLGMEGVILYGVAASVGLVGIALIWRWRQATLFWIVLAATVGFLITPYAMQYDYALLALPFFWVLKNFSEMNRPTRIVVGIGLAVLASVLFWEGPVTDGLWMPIILMALLILTASRLALNNPTMLLRGMDNSS